ncbi:hypothetical protein BKM14_14745 [Pseudomonas syringae pv. syringae]|uniref:XamI family restriction endonuclease n=1 Tax=Pseudomonas syringae TaxID=317 RepID=UPI000D4D8CD2|nr:XamI family restriction endonuclease [Pseudomonas syringae]POD32200.1 hypothetical protein BKM14_14745 [Pseudomonas syringae pv. syringae]
MRKDYLRNLDFEEAAAVAINTVVKGPQAMQFCAECQLGEREADFVIRLHDTKLIRAAQVVPVAGLAGVFKVLNLEQAQARGQFLFWSHNLDKLGAFIDSTK